MLILEKKREILQYQYVEWPDHGLPFVSATFLGLCETVNEFNPPNSPIVVHCSAGIGRTGTFCTVHTILEKLKEDMKDNPTKEPCFSVLETVLWMRDQRPGMVQTKEQYMFCYLAIEEALPKFLNSYNSRMVLN